MGTNICKSPLLLQGFRMSGSASNIPAGAIVKGQKVIQQQRGNAIFLDVLEMLNVGVDTNFNAAISVQTGGVDLLQTVPAPMFNPDAYVRSYNLTCVDLEAGQTVNWIYDNSASATANNAALHLYYENPLLLDKEFLSQFDDKARGLKERVYQFSAAAGARLTTSTAIQLPSDQGKIIGIQVYGFNAQATPRDCYQAFVSVQVNGETVIDNGCLGIGHPSTSRPYMRFPLSLEKSGTFEITLDNSNSGTINIFGIKFFFGQN